MWIVARNLMLAVFAGLANAGVFADCPKPDTTKAGDHLTRSVIEWSLHLIFTQSSHDEPQRYIPRYGSGREA